MAAGFVIPSIFTAVDKMSGPIQAMGARLKAFGGSVGAGLGKINRRINSWAPGLADASNQMFSFASKAALAAAVIGGITFATGSLVAYEKGLASFRTIVSDLSDKDFQKYKLAINDVAKETKRSSVDVVASFEKIAGLNAKFAETSDGLAAVSKAAITLSKASGDELGNSAENLVKIMNQFSLGAKDADRAINVLAAGQAVGAANIQQTSDAFVNFGSVAASANLSLEQSVALIQTVGKYGLLGAEAGTKLRGSILKLQQAGVGYANGQFSVNAALDEAKKKFDKLRSAKEKDAFLNKIFGAENISTGRLLLNNIGLINEFTNGVTGTTEAQKAAAINSNTLSNKLAELKAAFVNTITSSDSSNASLEAVKAVLGFLAENMDMVLTIVVPLTTAFLAATAAMWLLNIAMAANPVGLIIIGIGALIALVAVIIKKWDEWGETVAFFLGPLGVVISLIQAIRKNWDYLSKAFKNGGILEGLRAIGKTILEAILSPVQKVLEVLGRMPGALGAPFRAAAEGIQNFRSAMDADTEKRMQQWAYEEKMQEYQDSNTPFPMRVDPGRSELINPKTANNDQVVDMVKAAVAGNIKIQIEDKTGGKASVNSTGAVSPQIKTTTNLGAIGQ